MAGQVTVAFIKRVVFVATIGISVLGSALATETAHEVFARRCSACHAWSRDPEAVDSLHKRIGQRLLERDTHIRPLLNKAERAVVEAYALPRPPQQRASPEKRRRSLLPPRLPAVQVHERRMVVPQLDQRRSTAPAIREQAAVRDQVAVRDQAAVRDRTAALAILGRECGRCHGWARDETVLRRINGRIARRIAMGHGIRKLTTEERRVLQRVFPVPVRPGEATVRPGE